MKREYASDALMVCHQSAESLFRLGIIDAVEMKEFDNGCLISEPETVHEAENSVEMEHIAHVTA